MLLAHPVRAADPATALPSEQDFLADIPVVLSATRLRQPRNEAPAAMTIIDREMIEASGVTEIPELFRLVPGFQVGHDTNNIVVVDPTSVTYHGLSDLFARRMQVLIDGRSVYAPDFGGVRWERLPLTLDDIERIEIVRGPNAVTYGANAFLGVINIITRHPADVPRAFVRLVAGDRQNYREGIARIGGGAGGFDYRVTASYRGHDGFDTQPDTRQLTSGNFRGEYRLGPADTFDMQAAYGGGPHEAGNAGNDLDPLRVTSNRTGHESLRWRHAHDNGNEISLLFYHTGNSFNDRYAGFDSGLVLSYVIDQTIETHRYNVELQQTLGVSPALRVVWGAEGRYDEAIASDWFQSTGREGNRHYRLFGNAEWRATGSLVANLGLMAEHSDIGGTGLSPRLALNYLVNDRNTLRFSASRALRNPSIFEARADSVVRYSAPLGDVSYYYSPGNIVSEKVTAFELGYFGRLPALRTEIDLRLFHDEITDMTELVDETAPPFTGPYSIYRNFGYATLRGAEIALEYNPGVHTRLILNHAYVEQHGSLSTQSTDISTPRNTSSAMMIFRLPARTTFSVSWYAIDQMKWLGGGDIGAINKWDARLAREYSTQNALVKAELIAENITGSFADFRPEATFDSRVFVKLSITP